VDTAVMLLFTCLQFCVHMQLNGLLLNSAAVSGDRMVRCSVLLN